MHYYYMHVCLEKRDQNFTRPVYSKKKNGAIWLKLVFLNLICHLFLKTKFDLVDLHNYNIIEYTIYGSATLFH